MCEIKLNQLINKNPQFINSLYGFTFHPLIQKKVLQAEKTPSTVTFNLYDNVYIPG